MPGKKASRKPPRRKAPKKEKDVTDKRIDHFAEEIGAIGERIVTKKATKAPASGETRRVYRSGKDKILGGVCGGIAEYLDVDPVIIRLLWIVGTLAWGAGLILYIIAWIIIPRNPRHKW
jgi:phage shock protein PspC (stress-responsive transcriptional regulator)